MNGAVVFGGTAQLRQVGGCQLLGRAATIREGTCLSRRSSLDQARASCTTNVDYGAAAGLFAHVHHSRLIVIHARHSWDLGQKHASMLGIVVNGTPIIALEAALSCMGFKIMRREGSTVVYHIGITDTNDTTCVQHHLVLERVREEDNECLLGDVARGIRSWAIGDY